MSLWKILDLPEGKLPILKYEGKNLNDFNVASFFSSNDCFTSEEKRDSSVSVIEGAKKEDVGLVTETNCLCDNAGNKIDTFHDFGKKDKSCKHSSPQNTSVSTGDYSQIKEKRDILQEEQFAKIKKNIISETKDKRLLIECNKETLQKELKLLSSAHLSQSLKELTDLNQAEMNYFRSRFNRSSSYDHDRGRSAARGSSLLSNNTDKLLKDIRSQRMRTSTAAQSVSNNVVSSVFKRDNSASKGDNIHPYSFSNEGISKIPSRFLSKSTVSSPKAIPYSFSNTTPSSDFLSPKTSSQTCLNEKSSYSPFTCVENSSVQKTYSFGNTSNDPKIISTSTNERVDASLTNTSIATKKITSPKWNVEYQNTKEAESDVQASKYRPYSRSTRISFNEENNASFKTGENSENPPIEEYSINVKLVLNKKVTSDTDEIVQSKDDETGIETNNDEPCESSYDANKQTNPEIKGSSLNEGSFRRRRRPEGRMESNNSKPNSGAFRRKRRPEETKKATTKKEGGSKSSSFRRRRRQEDAEGPDDSNPFTKRNFDSEQKKSFDDTEDTGPRMKPSSTPISSYDIKDTSSCEPPLLECEAHQLNMAAEIGKGENELRSEKVPIVEKREEGPMIKPKDQMPEPLDCIEIKSAAQWKAMSELMTWNFGSLKEEPDEEIDIGCKLEHREGTEKVPVSINIEKPDEQRHITYKLPSYDTTLDPIGFSPVESKQLRLICWRVKPWKETKNRKLFTSQFGEQWGVDCDEVSEGLFVGDKASASNINFLKRYGITHVLNTAEGKDEGLVDLSSDYFEGSGITYLGFPLWDNPCCNLIPYFGCASEFIDNAVSSGGKCLVNCQMGVSRSSSCAIAYLMIKEGMCVKDVLTLFRKSRDCRPNDGKLLKKSILTIIE